MVFCRPSGRLGARRSPLCSSGRAGSSDRFHLPQALGRIRADAEWRPTYEAARRGDLLVAIPALQRSEHPEAWKVVRDLRANRDGLSDYRLQDGFGDPALRGLGAAEGMSTKCWPTASVSAAWPASSQERAA